MEHGPRKAIYCNCCSSITQHIEQHYDPNAITVATDDAQQALAVFVACLSDEECQLTLGDVQAYIESLKLAAQDAA